MIDYGREISIIHRYTGMLIKSKADMDIIPGRMIPYAVEICENPGLSQEEIAACLKIDKGSVARAVKRLYDLDLVRIESGEKDRRIHRIYPSEKMKRVHDSSIKARDEVMAVMLKGISQEDRDVFERVMVKMRDNIVKEVTESRNGNK